MTEDEQEFALSCIPDIHWANVYHDTIIGSKWLRDKAISPVGVLGMAVGYNFLYALYRILDEMQPNTILELGLGQSTKLTGQYAEHFGAKHYVVENDPDWVNFFCRSFPKLSAQTVICTTPLIIKEHDGAKYRAYQNFDEVIRIMDSTCNLIIVDGPLGGTVRSRRDIIPCLPSVLDNDFVIMIDDCGRMGEYALVTEIQEILRRHGIDFAFGLYRSGSTNHVGVFASANQKYFTTM